MSTAKPTSFEIAVAIAAPEMPIPSVKMKIGSRITFNTPPIPMPSMENTGLPSERRHWFKTKLAAI